ncbi:hypothetical protein, partial [Mesorhizobium japonicum]|uniref:hypothetical protein n=1 Tax=Mesorhizobium japonicum TaxID=2066070 RepID=UPI003B5C0692
MARPKQQRIDPRTADRRIAASRAASASGAKASPAKSASRRGRGRSGRPGGRPVAEARPATLGTWIAGARPQTLPMAIAAVAIGYGAASSTPAFGDVLTNHW